MLHLLKIQLLPDLNVYVRVFAEAGFYMYSLDPNERVNPLGGWNGMIDMQGRLVSRRRIKAWVLHEVAAGRIVAANNLTVWSVMLRYGLEVGMPRTEMVRNLVQCVLMHWVNAARTAFEASDDEMDGRQPTRGNSPARAPEFTARQLRTEARGQRYRWELPQDFGLLPERFHLRLPFARVRGDHGIRARIGGVQNQDVGGGLGHLEP